MTLRREVQPPTVRRGLTTKARKKQREAASRGRSMAVRLTRDAESSRRVLVYYADIVDVLWALVDAVEGKEK